MRQAVSTIPIPIDVGLGGVLLANMLAAWLDGDPQVLPTGEAVMNPKIAEYHRSRPAGIAGQGRT